MSSSLTTAAAAALLAALAPAAAGCRSREPLLYDRSGTPVAELEPAPFRIAVAPFVLPAEQAPLPATVDPARAREVLQQSLVGALLDARAASDVFALDSALSYAAFKEDADLLVRPRLDDVAFSHAGPSGRAVVSSLLWFTTWAGSLWVEDSTYDARLVVRYDLVDPHTGSNVARDLEARTETVDLSFWDRNGAFSGGFFASMVVPPFLTGDNEKRTQEALLRRANAQLAAQLKMYLRDGLPIREREVLADFQIKSPENGARLSGPTPFRCDILARRAVIEVQVFVNGKLLRRWDEEELPVPGAQAKAGYFVCPVRVDGLEAAQPGTNTIRILANIAGQWASRTLVVEREGVEAEALGPGGEELGLGTGGQTTLAGAIHDDDRKR